eukprot:TRINITY_DN161_c0_g1_i15.p1 TRINITY_DN161_c0_g1~~TRINITY_DN161_c0_g1_i15.p1  ORF type:complete len:437 (+),score=109.86 TRINITY_DN161_c0_g1_i15:89-1399(+)
MMAGRFIKLMNLSHTVSLAEVQAVCKMFPTLQLATSGFHVAGEIGTNLILTVQPGVNVDLRKVEDAFRAISVAKAAQHGLNPVGDVMCRWKQGWTPQGHEKRKKSRLVVVHIIPLTPGVAPFAASDEAALAQDVRVRAVQMYGIDVLGVRMMPLARRKQKDVPHQTPYVKSIRTCVIELRNELDADTLLNGPKGRLYDAHVDTEKLGSYVYYTLQQQKKQCFYPIASAPSVVDTEARDDGSDVSLVGSSSSHNSGDAGSPALGMSMRSHYSVDLSSTGSTKPSPAPSPPTRVHPFDASHAVLSSVAVPTPVLTPLIPPAGLRIDTVQTPTGSQGSLQFHSALPSPLGSSTATVWHPATPQMSAVSGVSSAASPVARRMMVVSRQTPVAPTHMQPTAVVMPAVLPAMMLMPNTPADIVFAEQEWADAEGDVDRAAMY